MLRRGDRVCVAVPAVPVLAVLSTTAGLLGADGVPAPLGL